MLEQLIERYEDDELLIADGFNDAIIGIDEQSMRIIYSTQRCIQTLIDGGMDLEEALEYFDYNVKGSYVGEKTPIWCEDFF